MTWLPDEFVARLRQIIPAGHYEPAIASFAVSKPVGLRVNRSLTSVDVVQEELANLGIPFEPLSWFPSVGLVPAEHRGQLTRMPMFADGKVYIQNPSSLLAALQVDALPGQQVLDLAAAPGGKTLVLAECMQHIGYLAAVERVRARFFTLQRVLREHGVRIARTFLADGRTIGRKTPNRFDRVLLDAPCSGEARFQTNDERTFQFWSMRKIQEQSRKQRGLLASAIQATKPGGTIVYSTCSFAPEENECIVDDALLRFGDTVELVPMDLPIQNVTPGLSQWRDRILNATIALTQRILPTESMDGLYLAKFRKLQAT